MIKIGMLVTCPVENNIGSVIFLLGKVISVNAEFDTCEVVFECGYNEHACNIVPKSKQVFDLFEVERAEVQQNAHGWIGKEPVLVLCKAKLVSNKDELKDFYVYYCEFLNHNGVVKPILESQLSVDCSMCANKTVVAMSNYMANLKSCMHRNMLIEKKSRLEITDEVVKTLVGTRVDLYKHQLDTILRATQRGTCRVMLADEVGLGKTIEAIALIRHYIDNDDSLKCLVIVPESLEYQWITELNDKFEIETGILLHSDLIRKKAVQRVTVVSVTDYQRYYYEISEKNWGMVVVDEAHKILNQRVYSYICKQCRAAKHAILLSATPVLRHANEYLKLLKLLDYSKYSRLSVEEFSKLITYQKEIKQAMLDIYSDMEMFGEDGTPSIFRPNLEIVSSIINDDYFDSIISKCVDEDKFGMMYVKMAINHINQNYSLESSIIRHRRNDIPEAQITRRLDRVVMYQMEAADTEVYEHNLYQAVFDEVNQLIQHDEKNIQDALKIIQALFSSPYAVEPLLNEASGEFEDFKKIRKYLAGWKQACDREIAVVKNANMEFGTTRFSQLRNTISNLNDDSKILIFSEFRETVKNIEKMLVNLYGKDSVATFVTGMNRFETQSAARRFQNDPECRFLVCDKCGGEGRNFQKADCIVHFDMPWSPALMEQRIGRLDRIGRDIYRDVRSIVICSAETVEESLFDLYNKSLRVFDHSLCGLEIVFEELQNMMVSAFIKDMQFGLSHVMSEIDELVSVMEKDVEDEIYFSNIQNENEINKSNIEEVLNAFDENKKDETNSHLIGWLDNLGIPSEVDDKDGSGRITIRFSRANTQKIHSCFWDWAADYDDVEGTFSRKYAIQHEELSYFSTNSQIVKNIFSDVDRNYMGRFASVRRRKKESNWCGWLFSWKIHPDINVIIKNGLYAKFHNFIGQFISEPYFYSICTIDGEAEHNEYELRNMLQHSVEWEELLDISDMNQYEILFDEDSWQDYCKCEVNKAKLDAKKRIQSCVLVDKLVTSYIDTVLAEYAHNKRESVGDEVFEIANVLREALINSHLEVCSAIYIEM